MIPLLVAFGLAHQGTAQQAAGLLVVADDRWKEQRVPDLCAEPEEKGVADLKALGYVLYEKGKDRLMFAPSIWQDDQMKRSMSIYPKLSASVRSDGTLNLADPDIKEFAQAAFAIDGVGLDSDSTVVIRLQRTYEMTVGGKTINVRGGDSRSREDNKRLQSRPVQYSGGTPLSGKGSPLDYVAVWPSSYTTFGFGAFSQGSQARLAALRRALEVLEARLAGYYAAKRGAYTAMNRKIANADISQDYGTSFDALPDALRLDMQGAMSAGYSSYGFQSSDDAMAFLHSAVLSGTNSMAMMYVFLGNYRGTPTYVGTSVP